MQQWRPPVHRHVGPHKRVSTLYWMVTMQGCGKVYEVVGGYGRIEQAKCELPGSRANCSTNPLRKRDTKYGSNAKSYKQAVASETQFEMQCNVRQCIEVCMYANHWASETMSSQ